MSGIALGLHGGCGTLERGLQSEADWAELDTAFCSNRDPLTGHEPEEGYRPLFRKIVKTAIAAGLQLFAQTHLTYNRHEFTLFFETV